MLTFYKTLFFLILFLFKTQLIYPQWIHTNGLNSGSVICFAVSGTNIFTSAYGYGVYLSTNNGTNWTPANNGLIKHTVNSLTVSGTNIFEGTDSGGVYLSTNNGTNWTQINNGLNDTTVYALAVSGTNIFAGIAPLNGGGGVCFNE
jgi:hypothetical protein